MQAIAFGPLSLTPATFWELTLAEFLLLIEGFKDRCQRSQQRDAWILANLLQPHTKEKLRPAMFLGEDQQRGWKKISEEEYQRLLKRKQGS